MAITIKNLAIGDVPTTAGSQIVPANTAGTLVSVIRLTKTTGSNRRVVLRVSPATAGTGYITETAGMLIPANSAVKFPEELALNSGQSIIGNADGTGVLVLASGLLKT